MVNRDGPARCSRCAGEIDQGTGICGRCSDPSSAGSFQAGELVCERYRIIGLLGRGGMGEVYRAEDLTLKETVALKVVDKALSTGSDAALQLIDEVRMARRVSHPSVCRVHDVGQVNDSYFLSMEFIDGDDLRTLVKRVGRLPQATALEIARDVARGLSAIHSEGVLHLDLKPANLMITDTGRVKITDFGMAGTVGTAVRGGTPAYMPPELHDAITSPAADIYSLGVVLYELITGRRPFSGHTPVLAYQHREVVPQPPSALIDDLDPRVERLILSCLEKDHERRPHADDVINVVSSVLDASLSADFTATPTRHRASARTRRAEQPPSNLRLRRWPPAEVPEWPYPVLLPYSNPEQMAGRKRELAKLKRLLRVPIPILGFHAPSGTGKSSLLMGGLVAWLKAAEWPVAYNRFSWEPLLLSRLLGDMIEPEPGGRAGGWRESVDTIIEISRLANDVPIIVIDQFEELLLRDHARPNRAELGAAMAATVRPLPGESGPPCRWLLAYRQEFHGDVVAWLDDVLADACHEQLNGIEELPVSLSGPERFHTTTLPPLGTPDPAANPLEVASQVFLEAINTPLELQREDGKPRYGWYFAPGHAERLATAFGRARVKNPQAPLTPELQVVLAHLLTQAGQPSGDQMVCVRVPNHPDQLIDEALAAHLRRSLETAFPPGRVGSKRGSTRALLALRELAHASGRRQEGLKTDFLARAIGSNGQQVLARLAEPDTRLVVAFDSPDGVRWVLSHDRMAEAIVRLVDDEGHQGDLTIDAQLLALRRFVTLESALFDLRNDPPDPLGRHRFRAVRDAADALLWDEPRQRWWQACLERRRRDLQQTGVLVVAVGMTLALAAGAAWRHASMSGAHLATLDQIANGSPESAMAAFDELASRPDSDPELLRAQLLLREAPMDVVELGLSGVESERRALAVLAVVDIALPLVEQQPNDPATIAALVWALDFSPGRDPLLTRETSSRRTQILAGLRRQHSPPDQIESFVDVPGGVLIIKSGKDVQTEVAISPFRLLDHEVTNAEYRRLVPDHPGDEHLPVASVNWYEAYTYAAWLGGRLPTRFEWSYAARAGCESNYCDRHGQETQLDRVAWVLSNSRPTSITEPRPQPIRRLEPNAWGLYDMLGNLWEWTASWQGEPMIHWSRDPWGPSSGDGRILMGGCFRFQAELAGASSAITEAPGNGDVGDQGFRVVLTGRGTDDQAKEP